MTGIEVFSLVMALGLIGAYLFGRLLIYLGKDDE